MTTHMFAARASASRAVGALALAVLAGGWMATGATGAQAASLPEIRTSERNRVPACVTPERLMSFVQSRKGGVPAPFRDIAREYKRHGEQWRVRWDYAFFQMLIETNFLTYRAPGGGMGDVQPRQHNFAGIGATGGGAPGDSFPNVSTGVLAQIHHLVVYSGERMAEPVAPRTRLKMDEILGKSAALGRPVTFQDLSGRWAVDRAYGRSIEWAAQSFRSGFCQGQPMAGEDRGNGRLASLGGRTLGPRSFGKSQTARDDRDDRDEDDDDKPRGKKAPTAAAASAPKPKKPLARPEVTTGSVRQAETAAPPEKAAAQRVLPAAPPATKPAAPAAAVTAPSSTQTPSSAQAKPPQAPAKTAAAPGVTGSAPAKSTTCKIFRASYGGPKTVLIQSQKDALTHYTVLEVTAGKEDEQAKAFIAAHATGGKVVAEFPTEADALKKSFELCPGG